jgi:hypothetical protein
VTIPPISRAASGRMRACAKRGCRRSNRSRVKRRESWATPVSGGEGCFALVMQWRLWRGLQSLPGQPL